jgi:hypothetical protein
MQLRVISLALLVSAAALSGMASATERGNPHTMTHANYCRVKLEACNNGALDWCGGKHSVALAVCVGSIRNQCSQKFGSGSGCLGRKM